MPQRGDCISGYRLEEPIAGGDASETLVSSWRITDLRRGVPRELRILSDQAARYADAFRTSAVAQGVLIHNNRLRMFDLIELADRPAAVVECVSGPSLATWLKIRERSVEEIVPLFEDIARGVAAAHHIGVHHLSLDASAIRLQSERGMFVPKLDLALGPVIVAAAAEGRSSSPGRLPPLPPLDQRADLFLLGTLLFEMIYRKLPYGPSEIANGNLRTLALPQRGEPLPDDISALLRALLDPRPSVRLSDIDTLLDALAAPATLPRFPVAPPIAGGAPFPGGAAALAVPAAILLALIVGMVAWFA